MTEYAILCRDYADSDLLFSQITECVPKKYIRHISSPPTRHTLTITKNDEILIHIMTKAYYERIFKYGFKGEIISSKTFRRKIDGYGFNASS